MKKKLVIFGNGSHSNVVLNELDLSKYNLVGHIVDKENKIVITKENKKILLTKFLKKKIFGFVAIGDNLIRSKIFNKFKKNKNFEWISIISKKALLQKNIKIGKGTLVMPGTVINTGAIIGDNCIINSSCVIEHDCFIGNNSNLCPGVVLGGNTKIGINCFIGMSACVSDNIIIQENTIIGAKAFMNINSIKNSKYFGIPAKKK
jgi:sugar O-acyltransferase (sialic acid O-acetyltransferase NeuD family)